MKFNNAEELHEYVSKSTSTIPNQSADAIYQNFAVLGSFFDMTDIEVVHDIAVMALNVLVVSVPHDQFVTILNAAIKQSRSHWERYHKWLKRETATEGVNQ